MSQIDGSNARRVNCSVREELSSIRAAEEDTANEDNASWDIATPFGAPVEHEVNRM